MYVCLYVCLALFVTAPGLLEMIAKELFNQQAKVTWISTERVEVNTSEFMYHTALQVSAANKRVTAYMRACVLASALISLLGDIDHLPHDLNHQLAVSYASFCFVSCLSSYTDRMRTCVHVGNSV